MQLEGIICDEYHYLTKCYEKWGVFNIIYRERANVLIVIIKKTNSTG